MNRMMRIIASFIAVSFSNASAVEFPDVGSFNPTWKSAQPGSSYDRSLPSAALLGNGSLGVVNGGDANHKKFVLTRGDLWSCGDLTPATYGPISFATVGIGPGMGSVKSTDTLDLETATLVTEGVFGKGKVRCESFVAAGEDVFVVTGISSADDEWVVRVMVHKEKTVFPREAKASADGFYVRRSTLNLLPKGDPRGWTTNATAAVSALGAVVTKPSATDDEGRATVKIRANKPFALFFCSDPARRFTWGKPLH